MHLKSLTLKGFKSFAQSTTFQFEPGVTAIIGPNGSGKSNVLDALAWVMGEQGAKTLRGGKMEDVIFAGTSTRGPLGRAEVRLTIDNSDGALPIEYSEVTISRILFRNGASEYAINGESCRLLDVQELLSDSGLGREMHVIVGQGQLDAVLRATAEDRRGFIEEAAGILKHRRRKERTVRKLEAMETNLTRLSDLAGEIRRQLKPLGRQAEVAKQAQEIAAEVRDAKARLLAADVSRLRHELDELSRGESERHGERIVLQEQLEQKQLRMERLEQEQQSETLDGARRITIALEAARSRLSGLLAQAQQRLTFLATQAEAPEQLQRLTQGAVDEAKAEADALLENIPAAELAWEDAGAATARAQQALNAIDEHIAAQSALVSQHDLELSKLRGSAEAAEQKLAVLEQEVARRQQAVQQAEERARIAGQELEAFLEALDGTVETGDGLDDRYHEAQQAQQRAEHARDELRERLHEREQERAGLDARVAALTRSLDQRDASAALLSDAAEGISGRVADALKVREGYEAVIGTALGVFADALLADDESSAGRAVSTAQSRDLGRVRAVLAHSAASAELPEAPELTRAADVVVEAPAGVRGLLSTSYLANDLEAALRGLVALRASSPALDFTIVTRGGEILTPHTLTGGSGSAPSRVELIADRDQAVHRQAQVSAEIESLTAELAAIREAASRAKLDAERAFGELRSADARAAETAEQRNRLSVRAESSLSEAERARAALHDAAENASAAAAEVERVRRDVEQAEARPRPILDVSQRDALSVELDAARENEVEQRLRLETARERARAAAARHELLREQMRAEQQAAAEAARRAVLRARQVERAERVAALLPAIQASCDRSLAAARLAQEAAEQERARHSQELTLIRSEESALRERLQALTEHVHSAELKSYERKLQLSSLLERAGAELGLDEDVLLAEYLPDAPTDAEASESLEEGAEPAESRPLTRDQQEQRLRRAERRLAELGRINPLALEEFAALEQRHTFLAEQLADLTKTRADLLSIISDLDEKMRDIFLDAFTDTQAAFAEVFPQLFPGGSGEIVLSDPENVLATGIEMTVRPAGKKVERLSLLSGGERSLAAVAWLIAIFRARPSPFYIMDEVEAALDDANLGRLLQVFEGLRENSQLIVITHQKRTMEIADALYGVSMRQDGISAVVGQRVGREE